MAHLLDRWPFAVQRRDPCGERLGPWALRLAACAAGLAAATPAALVLAAPFLA